MKRHLNHSLLPLVGLDSGTIVLLSFYIYYGKKGFFPFLFLLFLNNVLTYIVLVSHKKVFRVYHLLGKPKIDFLYDYMKNHTFIMSFNIILFTGFLFITRVTIGQQLLLLGESCLILLLTNSLVYSIFLRNCL